MSKSLQKGLDAVEKTRFTVVGVGFCECESKTLLSKLKEIYKLNKEVIKLRTNK